MLLNGQMSGLNDLIGQQGLFESYGTAVYASTTNFGTENQIADK